MHCLVYAIQGMGGQLEYFGIFVDAEYGMLLSFSSKT